jgi:hypothetical protein
MAVQIDKGRPYKANEVVKLASMPEGDWQLWRWWYPQVQQWVSAVVADVPVGLPPAVEGVEPKVAEWWQRVTSRRIDALLFLVDGRVWVVEVHAGPPLEALGRLVGYLVEARSDPVFSGRAVRGVLVVERSDATVEQAAVTSGVDLWVRGRGLVVGEGF